MIWNPDSRLDAPGDSAVVSHIAAEIDAYGGTEWLSKTENVEELAKADRPVPPRARPRPRRGLPVPRHVWRPARCRPLGKARPRGACSSTARASVRAIGVGSDRRRGHVGAGPPADDGSRRRAARTGASSEA